ncbi:PLEIOTROPIC DRUG RESISTANCE PROTEIN 2-LIKE [Salix viminalis]|uniref:PLEIOTROPIC DRUG RESISTANCE PROTEIN 2-LIKE n=1 Tax=Salix viminalis TaxID=40686 RepID=A0A9Q0ZPW0_SALVM|nr:PLEIOTROPIC DRUG RESISTANCE PROTEIN 2-LIKE [Salix viminalis]
MAAVLAGDDLARSMSSSGRGSFSYRSWASASIREAWTAPVDVFSQNSGRRHQLVDDEEELRWAAIERLPTYDRMRKGMLRQVLDNGRIVQSEVDVTRLGMQDKKQLMENILKVVEEDNEKFLRRDGPASGSSKLRENNNVNGTCRETPQGAKSMFHDS